MAAELGMSPSFQAPLLRTIGLTKSYTQRAPFSQKKFVIEAFKDVDLEIQPRRITALVGESGAGKSSLATCLAMLQKPDSGEIWFAEEQVSAWSPAQVSALRPKVQMVFQDSAGALNPRFTAAELIAEPLEVQRRASGPELRRRALSLMEEVGLPRDCADRPPLAMSGGQRQRLAIARALALQPALLILDESLSGLDLVTQSAILRLLVELQERHGLTYLLISHDLSLVAEIADFVAVMHKGRMVEQGPSQQVLSSPAHRQTRELVAFARALESDFQVAAEVQG